MCCGSFLGQGRSLGLWRVKLVILRVSHSMLEQADVIAHRLVVLQQLFKLILNQSLVATFFLLN